MSKYKLVPDPHVPGHRILSRDGKPCACPYQAPFMIQGAIQGQASLQYKGCGTWCALFNYNGNYNKAELLCSKSGIIDIIPAKNTTELQKVT
jgi:hypothetical protein